MARTICIANQKGGVGKTTTSVNLAAALAQIGRRVLIVDMDPQGNATSGLGIKRHESQSNNIYHVLIGEMELKDTLKDTAFENLKVAGATPDLVGAEIELVDMERREYRLKEAIKGVSSQFDYALIDCPPSLGLLTINALSAADTFLVPLQCEYYALEGLSQLLNTAGLIKKNLNQELKIEGIVLTMFDKRNNLSHQVVSEIQNHFGSKVFKSIIPRNVRLSEAPSHGQSILQYDPKSIGARKYLELAKELDQGVQLAAEEDVEGVEEESVDEISFETTSTPELEDVSINEHSLDVAEEPSVDIETDVSDSIERGAHV
jgi:chromosome partitioning protein